MNLNRIKKQADGSVENSFANKCRRRRMRIFEEFYVKEILKETRQKHRQCVVPAADRKRILDVGGRLDYWESMKFKYLDTADIVLLNLREEKVPSKYDHISSAEGDATNMWEYGDGEFDLCFSNSVIEHVGDFQAQKKMADEMRRVGKHIICPVAK